MKKAIYIAAMLAILLVASCKKDDGNHNYSGYNLTFWTAINCSPDPITVKVDSQTATITEYFPDPNAAPTCGNQWCANFNLPTGTYAYTASNGDTTWTGSVSVTKGNCTLQSLSCATGNVTFWVDSSANDMKVTMDNGSTHITTAFPTTTPTCGTLGCANFTLHIGTYTYTAITNLNVGYTGTVTVGKDSCTLVKIY